MKKEQSKILKISLLLIIISILFIAINNIFFNQPQQINNTKLINKQNQSLLNNNSTPKKEIKQNQPAQNINSEETGFINKTTKIVSEIFSNNSDPSQKIIIDIPFTTQAPFAEWDDARQQDACEEASMIMAWHWIKNSSLSKTQAKEEILEINAFMDKTIGQSTDTSAEDTLKIFKKFYQYDKAKITYEVTVENIKDELSKGNLIIIPTDGTILKNPYYSPPGPIRHMIVIKGFDEKKKQFITNDPGTKRGESFYYDYQIIIDSIINYATGDHSPLIDDRKVAIIIEK